MIIDKGVVREESLTREYEEALRLDRKQKPRIEVVDQTGGVKLTVVTIEKFIRKVDLRGMRENRGCNATWKPITVIRELFA